MLGKIGRSYQKNQTPRSLQELVKQIEKARNRKKPPLSNRGKTGRPYPEIHTQQGLQAFICQTM
jgi:hypothetical protein